MRWNWSRVRRSEHAEDSRALRAPYSDEFRQHLTRPELYVVRKDGTLDRREPSTRTHTQGD